jgi:hypothetical protein
VLAIEDDPALTKLPEVGNAAAAAEQCLIDQPDALQRNAFGNAFARLKQLGTALASPG